MRALLCALVLGVTAQAWADEPEGELTAAPGSIGYGMIEQADADGVFELVHDGQVTLRHAGSGMVCHFARDGDGGQIRLFPGLPRGDDVGCEFDEGGGRMYAFYATRFSFRTSLDQQIRGAETAIRRHFPDAQPIAHSPASASETVMAHRTAQFIVTREGVRSYTRASVAQVGDWTIKVRFTAPAPDDAAARDAEQAAGLIFAGVLDDIINAPRQ